MLLATKYVYHLIANLVCCKCCIGNVKKLYYHNYIIWPETTLEAPIETDRPKEQAVCANRS